VQGHAKDALHHIEKGIRAWESVRSLLWLGQSYAIAGHSYYLLGRTEAAIGNIEKGLTIQNSIGTLMWKASHYLYLSMIYFDMGDLDKSLLNAEEALSLSQKNGEREYEGLARIVLGRLAARESPSRFDVAEHSILEGIKILRDQELKPYVSVGHLHLGELYGEMGHTEKATATLKKAESMFQEMGMDYWLGKTQAVLAKL